MSERPGVNRLLVLKERPASEVAATLVPSVNAGLIAKSRVLRRLRVEGQGLIDRFATGPVVFSANSPKR